MFKWIFFLQAFIYLLLMPYLRSGLDIAYHPPLGAGILAIISLYAGFVFCNVRMGDVATISQSNANRDTTKLQPRPYLAYAIPALALLYAVMVVSFGLLNRRQGSEYMAELYAELPIYALAIIRSYEILLVPFFLLYAFGGDANIVRRRVVMTALLLSLPFTGIADSRSRLLLIALYIICFVNPKTFIEFLYRYVRFYLVAFVVVGAFVFYSYQRSSSYSSFNDYLFFEVYQRLDGLNLVTDMRDAGLIDKIGQFDFAMFAPLLSKIPFLEAARAAKLMGQTSTKQYYLQELLGRSQLDTSNSMIADPLYFAGWLGIIVAFGLIGYAIARSDRFVARGALMRNANTSAIAIAFATSFAVIENDLVTGVLSFVQNYIFVVLLLVFGTTRLITPSLTEQKPPPLSSNEYGAESGSVAIV
jgi:hypothetical protein